MSSLTIYELHFCLVKPQQSQQQSIFNGIAHHQQQQQQAQSTSQQLESSAEWEDVVIIPQQSSFYGGSSHNPMGGGGVGGGGNLLGTMPGATSFHPRGTTYQSNSNTGRHRTSYLITNLRSASNYEVRVQARNVHGWNKLSATFHFSTPAFEGELFFRKRFSIVLQFSDLFGGGCVFVRHRDS